MKALKIVGVGVVVLVAAVFVVGPMLAEWFVFRGDRRELKPLYRDYRTKKLTFPADALDVRVPSPETQAAARAFLAVWTKDSKLATEVLGRHEVQYRKAMAGDEPDFDPSLRDDLAQVKPFLDAWRSLVDRPDFEINVLAMPSADSEESGVPVPNYLMLQAVSKLAVLQSMADLSDGRTAEALDSAEAVMKSARAHPCDAIITQLIATAIRSIGASAEHVVVMACNDAALLRRALENEKRQIDDYRPMTGDSGMSANNRRPGTMVCDHVGMLRVAKQQGVEVPDIQQKTERELAGLSGNVEADYVEKTLLPKAQNDPRRTAMLKKQIDGRRRIAALTGGRVADSKGLLCRIAGYFIEPVLFCIAVPNSLEARTRDSVSFARIELVHLETARKLATIERGAPPDSLGALVPDYLDKPLADPFAQGSASFRMTGDTIYSVGPDGADQRAAVIYDPSNGLQSAGDIFFGSVRAR